MAAALAVVQPVEAPAVDTEARNEVMVKYLPLVKYVARRVASAHTLPGGLEHDDLVSFGLFGLLDAYERFEEARGVKFETFAIPRIRGAIVDELRHLDWVPRNVRTRARRINEASATLTSQLGRAPTRDELAGVLGLDELEGFERRGTPAMLIALEDLMGQDAGGDAVAIVETIVDSNADEPGSALEDSELKDSLIGALAEVGERDRLILTLYYFENMPLGEIARLLGVTESRVSQLHTRALNVLRQRIAS